MANILKLIVQDFDLQGLLKRPDQKRLIRSAKKPSTSPQKVSAQQVADAYMEAVVQSSVGDQGDATTRALRAQMVELIRGAQTGRSRGAFTELASLNTPPVDVCSVSTISLGLVSDNSACQWNDFRRAKNGIVQRLIDYARNGRPTKQQLTMLVNLEGSHLLNSDILKAKSFAATVLSEYLGLWVQYAKYLRDPANAELAQTLTPASPGAKKKGKKRPKSGSRVMASTLGRL